MRGNIHGGKLKQKRVCLGVQVSEEMHNDLVDMADHEELTISDIVRKAIKLYKNSKSIKEK